MSISKDVIDRVDYIKRMKWTEQNFSVFSGSELVEAHNNIVEALVKENEELKNVIDFVLHCDEPIEFLRCWNEGDWRSIRREWAEFKGYAGEGEEQSK